MLTLKNLTYSYNNTARRLIWDFKVKSGDIHHLQGTNGSGKSTLLHLIAGILPPTTGDILYNHQTLQTSPIHQRPIAYMMQEQPYFPHLTVQKTFNLTHIPSQDVQDALALFDLSHVLPTLLSDLSGGQRQIILFLHTLLLKRPIILLDEPFSHMDAHHTKTALAYLQIHIDSTQALCVLTHHADTSFSQDL